MFSFAGLLQLRVAGSSELLTVTCPSLSEAENIADLIDGYCRLVNNSPTSIWMRRGKIRTPWHTRSSSLYISHFYMNVDPGSTWVSDIQENSVASYTDLRFCHQVPEFEKTSKKKLQNNFLLLKNANCNQRSTIPVYFLTILNIFFKENFFLTKNWP